MTAPAAAWSVTRIVASKSSVGIAASPATALRKAAAHARCPMS